MDNQLPDDGLKWFGEGFDGFPKRLPDDCVEYMIYIINDRLDSPASIRSRLNEILRAANDLKKRLLKEYIWQKDEFELHLCPKLVISEPTERKRQERLHLRGRTSFGDSVADEWLIVYLLVQLSQKFSDVWIRMYDGDGEFLLIEAADALPKWLNPEIAENRIWINDGHIKIIPVDKSLTLQNLSISAAALYIRTKAAELLVDTNIESTAFNRIRDYPGAIPSSLHNAFVTIPRNLAYILHENPSYTSSASEAFYLRDPISLKPLNTKDLSTLIFAPEDFVTVSVKFTKVNYAQLRSQRFDAPPAWTGVIPRLHDEKASIGMKLTCGFEMLLSDPQNQTRRNVREIKLLLSDLENDEDALPPDTEIASWPRTQDDEKWLEIDYRDFEAELSDKSKPPSSAHNRSSAAPENDNQTTAGRNLNDLVSRFRDFMDGDEADELGDSDDDDTSSTSSASSVSSTEFQRAIDFTRTQNPSALESSGLISEARKLALEAEGDPSDERGDDDPTEEEIREIMARMERELRGHGALQRGDNEKAVGDGAAGKNKKGKEKGKKKRVEKFQTRRLKSEEEEEEGKKTLTKPFFGPERPPGLLPPGSSSVSSRRGGDGEGEDEEEEEDEEDVGPGDVELSSDEEDDQGVNDVDLEFAKNMLEAFKGQAGMSGPAGNLMRALGVKGMPRDEGEEGEE